MDLNNLLQALQYSVGKTQEEVKMAEQFLSQAITIEGYIRELLLISCNKEVPAPVRLAAIIHLKSSVQGYWKEDPQNGGFPEKDKATLRDSILDALITCINAPKIYRQIEEIIKFVANVDFPTVWKDILTNIDQKLRSSQKFSEIFGCLLALKNLITNYRFSAGQEREPLEPLVANIFPVLEQYAQNLLSNYTEEAAVAMHAILKIFYAATENGLPQYFYQEKILDSWMLYLILIMNKNLDANLESPTGDFHTIEERSRNIFWINKKNCGKIISNFIVKYTLTTQPRKPTQLWGISQLFLQKYAGPFLDASIQILYKKKQIFVPVKVQFFAMKYIYRSLNYPSLQQPLLAHLESLMFDFLLPSMYLNPEDEGEWTQNPIEFIRKEEDLHERSNNLKSVAKDYFITICGKDFKDLDGKLFCVKFMEYAAQVLAQNIDPRTSQQADIRLKEAVLHVIGLLKESILANEFLRPNMEYLLQNYVTPEFGNSLGFLRYRACWLFGVYSNLEFENFQNVETSLGLLYKCLEDNDFPVRVNAGIALNCLLRQPGAVNVVKPALQKVLETYITLIDTIDNDRLVKALEGIIDKFENDIHPYAFELIQHLARTFYKVHNDNNNPDSAADDEDEDEGEQEERGIAATEYLSAVAKILKCGLDKEMVAKLEATIMEIVQFTFSEEGWGYIEAGLEILASFLYSSGEISEQMWKFYPELNYMISGKPQQIAQSEEQLNGWGLEFLDDVLPCLQNYIQKGRNVIFAAMDPYFNITYLQLLFKTIDTVYDSYYKKKNIEAPIVSVLFITLLENYPKQINDLVPIILEKVTKNLQVPDTDFQKILIQTASMCFWYDAGLCFGYLSPENTEFLFNSWLHLLPQFNQDYECQRLMFGLASIFREDVMRLPTVVLNALPGLLKQTVNLSSKTLELREKDENEEAEEDEDEKKRMLQSIMTGGQKGMGGFDDLDDDDDDEDDEDFNYLDEVEPNEKGEYKSPLEDQCEVLYLRESLTLLEKNQPEACNQLMSCLDDKEKNILFTNFSKAETQQFEFEKFRQEEDQKRQMRALDMIRQ